MPVCPPHPSALKTQTIIVVSKNITWGSPISNPQTVWNYIPHNAPPLYLSGKCDVTAVHWVNGESLVRVSDRHVSILSGIIHSPDSLLGIPIKYWVGTPFASRTTWIIWGILPGVANVPQGCWSMLTQWHHTVSADWTAVHSCWEQPVPFHPKDGLLGWGLGTDQDTKVNWTRCHVPGDVHFSIVQSWWWRAHWSRFFLFLADRSGTQCGRLLQ